MTPEERAEALVAVVAGDLIGDWYVAVGGVQLSVAGFTPDDRDRTLRSLRAEVALVVREAEADLIPSAIRAEQPVGEERLAELRARGSWEFDGFTMGYARDSTHGQVAELLSLLDYYRACVVALASETGYRDGYDAGRRDGYREILRLIHADRAATRSGGDDPPAEIGRLVKLLDARLSTEGSQ
jgi:hypothetical protein